MEINNPRDEMKINMRGGWERGIETFQCLRCEKKGKEI